MNSETKFDKVLSQLIERLNPLLEDIRLADRERSKEEIVRQENEYKRLDNDNLRAEAERVRQENENERISAEAERKNAYEVVATDVKNWLDEHPEATTTVQDSSLEERKFSEDLKIKSIKDFVTPEMYGAVGNGVADDTEAIRSCFNAVNNSKKSIVFTSGKTYKITDKIDISGFGGTNKKKEVIGYGSKILISFDGFCFDASCSTSANGYNCTFKGLCLTASTSGVGSGFNVNYYQLLDFEDCTFENLKYGIYSTDMYYQNIIKCQFIGCGISMVFDVSRSKGINNVTVDRCRITNSFAGVYIKGLPNGFRICNCSIEGCTLGICGPGKVTGISTSLFITHNYFENATGEGVYDGYYHIILSGVEINEEATEYTKITGANSICAYITRNYYCGKSKISLGCEKYYLKENKYYLPDNTIEVNNGTSTANTHIYMDDDEFVKINGNSKFRTRIIGKNDIVAGSLGGYVGYNKLVRKLRESPYFVNGIGKLQRITNMDMITPPYDGSFNPDESLKYPSKTNIKINGNNYSCSVITAQNSDYRAYSDNVPCFTKISNIISSTNADERYVVDKTSGMLIDYATRSYKGTIYGTEDTTNPAYGEEAPETAVSAPVANELYYHITNASNYQGVYYLYDADISSWVECSFAALTDTF